MVGGTVALNFFHFRQGWIDLHRDLREFDLHPYVAQNAHDFYFFLNTQIVDYINRGCGLLRTYWRDSEYTSDMLDTGTFNKEADRAMESESHLKRLAVIAEMTEGVFLYKLKQIQGLPANMPWLDFLERLASARRCIMKAAVALENSLAELINVKPELNFQSEVNRGLIVRRLYADYRYAIQQLIGRVGTQEVVRVARHHISMMLRLDAYEYMRFSDRRHLVVLKQRMTQVLSSKCTDDTGLHLLEEIQNTASLIMDINHRQELMEHDLQRIHACIEAIDTGRLDLVPSLLHDLIGRSAKLDRFVIATVPVARNLLGVLVEMKTKLKAELCDWSPVAKHVV